jgi:membrane-bound metal-dependent hydrolase YbcI (DUF457 family)
MVGMMETPSVAFDIWIRAAFDPVLIVIACWMGWKADQYAKVVLAVIAAVALSVLTSWLLTRMGTPVIAPVGREYPTLLPVRTIGSLIWFSLAFLLHMVLNRKTG